MEKENKDLKDLEMDEAILESIIDMANMSVLSKMFEEFCDKYLNKEGNNCDNCVFNFCKSQQDCKAMYLRKALEEFNSKLD